MGSSREEKKRLRAQRQFILKGLLYSPILIFTELDTLLGRIFTAATLFSFFNRPLARSLVCEEGFSPMWSLIPLVLLYIIALLKFANKEKEDAIESAVNATKAELAVEGYSSWESEKPRLMTRIQELEKALDSKRQEVKDITDSKNKEIREAMEKKNSEIESLKAKIRNLEEEKADRTKRQQLRRLVAKGNNLLNASSANSEERLKNWEAEFSRFLKEIGQEDFAERFDRKPTDMQLNIQPVMAGHPGGWFLLHYRFKVRLAQDIAKELEGLL